MTQTKRIIIVDDHIARLLQLVFEDTQYQFTAYAEIEGAVERIRAAQPDLVILDLYFYGRPLGLDAFHALRSNATTAELPIIVTTAALNEAQTLERELRERPIPDLRTRVMTKPFEHVEDILVVIGEMLEA